MKNTNYRAIQIPVEAYTILKKFCDYNDKKIGKTIESLIKANCQIPDAVNPLTSVIKK